MLWIGFYLLLLNVLAFAMMGIDKRRAKRHAWRIPESKIFLAAILGGSLGSWVGMYVFHHKTKHSKFVVGIPLILILQLVVVFAAWSYCIML